MPFLNPIDAFLLVCSDGLVDGMSPDNAYKIAKASKTPQEAVRRMVTASEMGVYHFVGSLYRRGVLWLGHYLDLKWPFLLIDCRAWVT